MPNWTEEQKEAIYKSGQNIIVSAGAGSGKTAVLTERVIEKLKSGVNINNLLILTFTNKAAQEMKDRIRSAISKEESLEEQLDYIDSSYITTFDSFSLSIVKKYGYTLNLGKNINIADASTIYLETKKIIDDIFDKKYEENNKNFLKIINDFTTKNDEEIKKYILNINNALDLKINKKEYLDNYIKEYYSSKNIDLLVDSYNKLLISIVKELELLLKDFSYEVETDFYLSFEELFTNLLNSSNYLDIKNNVNIELPRLPKSSDEAKDIKDSIKKTLDRLADLTRFENVLELKETLLSTKEYVEAIIEIIKELDERLYNIKKELNIYDFIDISKMGIEIIKNNENIREELKKSFEEIMIDEYQDTSDVQEEFISLIANNNVYMVGDIKQSIYRFRNANPYLFKEKYDNYSKNNGGIKIDLTKNFRSREEVVNDINTMFSYLMTDLIGGADYKVSHKMIAGNQLYSIKKHLGQESNLEIINYEFDKDLHFTKEEIEIFYIAQDIKKKIEDKYQVLDKKTGELRDANYKDFTILLDRSSNFDLYKKVFQYFQIPLTKYSATNIIEENEIILIKNILKLLINQKEKNYDVEFKYAFTSIARSYLFEMDDEEIFDMVTNNKYSGELLDVIDSIIVDIDNLSLNEIISEIIDKFKFYSKFILVGDINNRINRITSIIDIFNNLSSINYSIEEAYLYLNELIDNQYKIEVKEQNEASNSVKIMTIHASKGLEFSICYFASFHSKFNKSDIKDRFMYSSDFGIISPYFKEGIGSTFVKDLVKNKYDIEEISERIRLLYVALTRAKEKMIIVTSIPDKELHDAKKINSFLDMIIYSKNVLKNYIKNMDINKLNLTKKYNLIEKSNYQETITKTDEKLVINELNIDNEQLTEEHISKENNKLIDKETKDKMEFGTKVHEILELIDFKNPDYDNLDIDDFFKSKIKNFIDKLDINNIINTYKEYEFLYEKDNNLYHGIIDLIVEYEDSIKIIDYKLKNTEDDAYIKQLNSYKDYISTKTNKKIDIYLFSIISGTFNKI